MSEATTVPGPKRCTDLDAQIGGRVRDARMRAGLSQSALADALNISFQQIQKYEKGRNRFSASTLQRVADLLGVPVVAFYDAPGELRTLEASLPTVAQAKAALLKASDALAEAKAREAAALQVAA